MGATNRIQVIGLDGAARTMFGGPADEDGARRRPMGVVQLPEGGTLVAVVVVITFVILNAPEIELDLQVVASPEVTDNEQILATTRIAVSVVVPIDARGTRRDF